MLKIMCLNDIPYINTNFELTMERAWETEVDRHMITPLVYNLPGIPT